MHSSIDPATALGQRNIAATGESQVQEMFDRIAPRYDFLNSLLSMRQDRRWRRALVAAMPLSTEGTLVDVATGTGEVLWECLRQRDDYRQLIGVDLSPKMLQHAQEKMSEPHLAAQLQAKQVSTSLAQGSAEKIPLKNDSADCVTIAFGLRNVIDRDRALREFARILKPQGSLFILEFFDPEPGIMTTLFQFYFRHVLPLIGGLISDREAYRYLPRSVASFYRLPQLQAALAGKGLTLRAERRFLFGSCRLIHATKTGEIKT